MSLDEVIKFAKAQGYKSAEQVESWKGFDVFEPVYDTKDEISVIGLPLVILVKGDQIRMSTPDEAIQCIDDMN